MGKMGMIILVPHGGTAHKRFYEINSHGGRDGARSKIRQREKVDCYELGSECSLQGCPELGQEGHAFIHCIDESLDAGDHGRARPWARHTSLKWE